MADLSVTLTSTCSSSHQAPVIIHPLTRHQFVVVPFALMSQFTSSEKPIFEVSFCRLPPLTLVCLLCPPALPRSSCLCEFSLHHPALKILLGPHLLCLFLSYFVNKPKQFLFVVCIVGSVFHLKLYFNTQSVSIIYVRRGCNPFRPLVLTFHDNQEDSTSCMSIKGYDYLGK